MKEEEERRTFAASLDAKNSSDANDLRVMVNNQTTSPSASHND